MKPASSLAALLLLMVAAAHLLRVILDIPVTIGPISLPIWPSIIAVIVPVLLAVGLWRENRK